MDILKNTPESIEFSNNSLEKLAEHNKFLKDQMSVEHGIFKDFF